MPTITGTDAAEVLTGTGAPDLIDGAGGADTITGGGGADTLNGGDGDDLVLIPNGTGISGGRIDGGAGVDTVDASGYQIPVGMIQSHIVTSSSGVATLSFLSRFAPPPLIAFPNPAVIGTVAGVEIFVFGAGGDNLDFSGMGSAMISGGDGNDRIIGGTQAGTLSGGTGADSVVGGAGTDSLDGGAGNDSISGAGGADTVDGGEGADLLRLAGQASDHLFQQTANGWTIYSGRSTAITVSNIEFIQFGPGFVQAIQAVPAIDFNAESYLARYADLRAAFGTDVVKAFQHFQTYGAAEGRTALETPFNALSYIASYSDLIRAFGTNAAAGTQHYAQYGQAEGRSVTFDPLLYAAGHSDLARIIGMDADAAASHYITYGLNEGRAVSGFDSVAYLLSNPDLARMSPREALSHWLTYGADEGRSGDAEFGREQGDHAFVNSVASGLTDSRTDRDWFSVNMPVGRDVTLTASTTTIDGIVFEEVQIALYDGGGRLLASRSDGGSITWRAVDATDGPYYLVVTPRTNIPLGDYEITQSIGPSRSAGPEAGVVADAGSSAALAEAAFALPAPAESPFEASASEPQWTGATVTDWTSAAEVATA